MIQSLQRRQRSSRDGSPSRGSVGAGNSVAGLRALSRTLASIATITFACEDPEGLAEFWVAAVECALQEVPSGLLEAIEAEGGDTNAPAAAVDPEGQGPRLFFRKMPPSSSKSIPIHLDLDTEDREAEVERLAVLGATVVETKTENTGPYSATWSVLGAPEGNGFCVQSAFGEGVGPHGITIRESNPDVGTSTLTDAPDNGFTGLPRVSDMPSRSTCQAEIERLHDCFVEWFTAAADEEAFDRIEDALAPEFEMVTPAGERVGRTAVLESIHDSYGRHEPGAFDIDIRNVELGEEGDGYATVRYEEWQETPAGTTGRVSTVLVREDSEAPGGLLWVDLHETWLD